MYGAVDGPGGPCTAPWIVRGDHVQHCRWSGGTMYGAVDGPGGPCTAPWMVLGGPAKAWGDRVRRRGWSGGTVYGAVDGPGDHVRHHRWSGGTDFRGDRLSHDTPHTKLALPISYGQYDVLAV